MWTPADVIQWIVVIVSLLALWVSYRAYRTSKEANAISAKALKLAREAHERDRGELTVRMTWNLSVSGPRVDPNKTYGVVHIANTGRRPVTIVGAMVVGCIDKVTKAQKGGIVFVDTATPTTLQEGEVFPKPLIVDPVEFRSHAMKSCPEFSWGEVQVLVEDSAGNSYWSDKLPEEKWPR